MAGSDFSLNKIVPRFIARAWCFHIFFPCKLMQRYCWKVRSTIRVRISRELRYLSVKQHKHTSMIYILWNHHSSPTKDLNLAPENMQCWFGKLKVMFQPPNHIFCQLFREFFWKRNFKKILVYPFFNTRITPLWAEKWGLGAWSSAAKRSCHPGRPFAVLEMVGKRKSVCGTFGGENCKDSEKCCFAFPWDTSCRTSMSLHAWESHFGSMEVSTSST